MVWHVWELGQVETYVYSYRHNLTTSRMETEAHGDFCWKTKFPSSLYLHVCWTYTSLISVVAEKWVFSLFFIYVHFVSWIFNTDEKFFSVFLFFFCTRQVPQECSLLVHKYDVKYWTFLRTMFCSPCSLTLQLFFLFYLWTCTEVITYLWRLGEYLYCEIQSPFCWSYVLVIVYYFFWCCCCC